MPSKGDVCEAAVAKYLSESLGTRYAIATHGHVFDSTGLQSNELDVVIFDDYWSGRLTPKDSHEPPLIPVESVYAVLQVKKTLSSSHPFGTRVSSRMGRRRAGHAKSVCLLVQARMVSTNFYQRPTGSRLSAVWFRQRLEQANRPNYIRSKHARVCCLFSRRSANRAPDCPAPDSERSDGRTEYDRLRQSPVRFSVVSPYPSAKPNGGSDRYDFIRQC